MLYDICEQFSKLEYDRRISELRHQLRVEMKEYYKDEDIDAIMNMLSDADDDILEDAILQRNKSPKVAITLSVLLGIFGVDEFYLGNTRYGILKMLSLGGFGIWYIVDIVKIKRKTFKLNFDNMTAFIDGKITK